MFAEGHLVMVLHAPPMPDSRERETRLFWRSPDGSWCSTSKGSSIHSLKEHLRDFTQRADQLEHQLQSASGADNYFTLLQELTPLHRTSRNLHATLQQARDFVPDDRNIISLRDAASDLERSLELLHSDARHGLDYTIAKKTELQSQKTYEMSLSAHRLNILAAIFFPTTAISSIFGMNIKHGLESVPSTVLFWGLLILGFFVGLILAVAIAQRPSEKIEVMPTPDKRERKLRTMAMQAKA